MLSSCLRVCDCSQILMTSHNVVFRSPCKLPQTTSLTASMHPLLQVITQLLEYHIRFGWTTKITRHRYACFPVSTLCNSSETWMVTQVVVTQLDWCVMRLVGATTPRTSQVAHLSSSREWLRPARRNMTTSTALLILAVRRS